MKTLVSKLGNPVVIFNGEKAAVLHNGRLAVKDVECNGYNIFDSGEIVFKKWYSYIFPLSYQTITAPVQVDENQWNVFNNSFGFIGNPRFGSVEDIAKAHHYNDQAWLKLKKDGGWGQGYLPVFDDDTLDELEWLITVEHGDVSYSIAIKN